MQCVSCPGHVVCSWRLSSQVGSLPPLVKWSDSLFVLHMTPRERQTWVRFPLLPRIIFQVESYTSDLKVGTPVASLPGAWCFRISAGTGCSSVSILWLGEIACLIHGFYPSVAACTIVPVDPIRPWDTHACRWDVKQPTNDNVLKHVLRLHKKSNMGQTSSSSSS